MKDRTIDLRRIVRDLKDHLLIIIISAALLGVLFALTAGIVAKNVYTSTAEFAIVDNQQIEERDSLTNKDGVINTLEETCLALLESESFIGDALRDCGFDHLDIKAFIDNNLKSNKGQGVVFSIDVSTDEPDKSYRIAESISNNLEEIVPLLSGDYRLAVLDKPIKEKEKNNKLKAGAMGIIIGLLLAFMYIVIHGLVTLKIKDKSDIELVTDIPVIAEFDLSTKNGAAGNPYCCAETIRTVRNEIEWNLNRDNKVVALVSADGAVSQKQIALQTAASFAASRKKVLLIDGNFTEKDLTELLKETDSTGFSDALEETSKLEKGIREIPVDGFKIDIMPFGTQSTASAAGYMDHTNLTAMFDILKEQYDIIIINGDSLNNSPESVLLTRTFNNILVVDTRVTKLDSLKTAIDKLQNINGNTTGIIMCR